MPNVTLRLTDEQHASLVGDAERNERSLQRELIYRLFSVDHVPRRGGAGAMIPAHTTADEHFKPDPKPAKAEKKGRR